MVALSILLLWLTFRHVNLTDVWDKIKAAKMWWVLLSMAFAFLAIVSRAYRWNMLIESSGYKPLLSNSTYAVLFAYLANLAFPRLGEVTRCGALSKKENIPFDILLGTVIVERAIDVICLLLSIALVFMLEFQTMGNFLYEKVFKGIGASINLTSVAIMLLALVGIGVGLRILFKSKTSSAFVLKIRKMVAGVISGLSSIKKIRNLPIFIFHTFFIWLMYYFMIYVCFFSLPATAVLGIKECFLILVAGGLGMSAPAPGGIGAYHKLVSEGLALYDVPISDGVAFATLLHTSQIVEMVVCGVFALIMLGSGSSRISKIKA